MATAVVATTCYACAVILNFNTLFGLVMVGEVFLAVDFGIGAREVVKIG